MAEHDILSSDVERSRIVCGLAGCTKELVKEETCEDRMASTKKIFPTWPWFITTVGVMAMSCLSAIWFIAETKAAKVEVLQQQATFIAYQSKIDGTLEELTRLNKALAYRQEKVLDFLKIDPKVPEIILR
jgi:hypothetical protein